LVNCATCTRDEFDAKQYFAEKQALQAKLEREEKENKKVIENLEKEIVPPAGVKKYIYIDYLAYYGPEWSDFQVTSEKTLEKFKEYFGTTPYRVIWHWDIDGCGYNDYLAVEVYPKVRRGIKKGIVVDEIGRIKFYIDTIKGIYTPEYMVLDLERLGHRRNEVECYSIGYIPWNGVGKRSSSSIGKKSLDGLRERSKEYPGHGYSIGIFLLQRLDKHLKIMSTGNPGVNSSYMPTDTIEVEYDAAIDKVVYGMYLAINSLEEEYKEQKKFLEMYRIDKKRGRVYGPPAVLDPVHVEKAVRIRNLQ
jgi:hypothetical protein